MKGRDGREYTVRAEDRGVDTYFKVIDKKTEEVVDEGWLVISKNRTLRVERIK